ncbi:hypothetical protein C1645_828061 [Glomus cerebriforme]|uniref:Uncharacterized protein n=1 Tax=Glomus cerebriforme TaxID=658196 RepID=A0A397SWV6_9GLOM|nr:hypothetical protein C1645_828061 [Glomus cerebriforme]
MGVTVSTYSDKLFNEYIRNIGCKDIGNKKFDEVTAFTQHHNLWHELKNKDGNANNLRRLVKGVSDYTQFLPTILQCVTKKTGKSFNNKYLLQNKKYNKKSN